MKIQEAPAETWITRPCSKYSIITLYDGSYQMWNGFVSVQAWGLTSWEQLQDDWEVLS